MLFSTWKNILERFLAKIEQVFLRRLLCLHRDSRTWCNLQAEMILHSTAVWKVSRCTIYLVTDEKIPPYAVAEIYFRPLQLHTHTFPYLKKTARHTAILSQSVSTTRHQESPFCQQCTVCLSLSLFLTLLLPVTCHQCLFFLLLAPPSLVLSLSFAPLLTSLNIFASLHLWTAHCPISVHNMRVRGFFFF